MDRDYVTHPVLQELTKSGETAAVVQEAPDEYEYEEIYGEEAKFQTVPMRRYPGPLA